MRKIFYIIILFGYTSFGQQVINYKGESINKMDSQNNKIGLWKIFDLKRNIEAYGEIENNEKFAEINYSINGKLFATQKQDSIVIFYEDNEKIETIFSWKNRENPIIKKDGNPINDVTKKKFFQTAELPAMFYGGAEGIAKFFKKNVDTRIIGDASGKIIIEVVINKDGKVESPMIVSSSIPKLNEECIRVANKMPRWQPGIQQGHFVRTTFRIPLTF